MRRCKCAVVPYVIGRALAPLPGPLLVVVALPVVVAGGLAHPAGVAVDARLPVGLAFPAAAAKAVAAAGRASAVDAVVLAHSGSGRVRRCGGVVVRLVGLEQFLVVLE